MKLRFPAVLAFLVYPSTAVFGQDDLAQWTATRASVVTDVDFTTIGTVLLDPSGLLYVSQPAEQSILILTSDGKVARRVGRRGRGPGEFLSIALAGWLGDSLWVSDPAQRRTIFFSRDGRELRTENHVVLQESEAWRSRPTFYLDDGSVLSVPGLSGAAVSAGASRIFPVRRLSRAGDVLDTVTFQSARGRMLAVDTRGAGRVLISYQPFNDDPMPIVSADGSKILIVNRPTTGGGSRSAFDLVLLSADGDTTWHVSHSYAPRAIGRTVVDSIVSGIAASIRVGNEPAASVERAVRAELYVPTTAPPITAGIFASDGSIWLRQEDLGQPQLDWLHINGQNGLAIASVQLSRLAQVKAASPGEIWAVELDEFDVPRLVRYHIRRAR